MLMLLIVNNHYGGLDGAILDFNGEFRGREGLALGGMLKKAASGVLALLPCSRTMSTLRASKGGLRPFLRLRSGQDWTDFFEHSLPLTMWGSSGAFIGYCRELFNSPLGRITTAFWCPIGIAQGAATRFLWEFFPENGFGIGA